MHSIVNKNISTLGGLVVAVLTVVGVTLSFPHQSFAALPAGFEVQTIASGLVYPTSMAFAPDGRIFVAEKAGAVRIIKNGQLLPAPLVQLTDVNTYADRGLLGIAVDPNFSTNKFIYLSYTHENSPGSNFTGPKTGKIVRLTVVGDTASESTKVVLVGTEGGDVVTPSCENFPVTTDCIPSDSSSHSMGGLRFGPDGKLYATLGDGSNFDAIDSRALRAQNIDSLAGKMLRINTDGTGPADNPFYNGDPNANRSKVFAYGFRNMYRFNFRPGTSVLYGGDVGWDTWEEINKIVPGGNYGWPCREGDYATTYNCVAPNYTNPFYSYVHDPVKGGAITVGAFGGTNTYPAQYSNTLFFADYALNWIKMADVGANNTLGPITDFMTATDGAGGPVEMVTGPEGAVYFISIYTGSVRKITHTSGNRQPIAQISGTPVSGVLPLSVQFSSTGSSDPDADPLSFSWNFGDGTNSTQANPQHIYSVNGTYTAVLTVSDGKGGVDTKSMTIFAGNRAPQPTITTPANGEVYFPGEILDIAGAAVDPEDGTLPGTSLSWKAILHHNTHTHLLETHVGSSFQFVGPDHSDPDVYTEIELTAVDSGGLSTSTSINLYLNNNVSPDGNMVRNQSMEEVDPLNPNEPNYWNANSWGTNTATFTYPVAGQDGTKAAQVTVSGYVSGDAKWLFDPARIKENKDYVFSNYYKATIPTRLVAEFGYINGTYTYEEIAAVPASGTWTKTNAQFHTPAGARTVNIYHIIEGNGTLTVDNYSLKLPSATTPPPAGNLIVNPSLEVGTTTPDAWFTGGWGTNTPTFTYPVAGVDGVKAAKVTVSGYTSGDAKWYFQDVPVTAGTVYTFTSNYQATVATSIVARFKSAAGVYTYADLGALPASAGWAQVNKSISIPSGVVSMTVFHLLQANGSLTIDNYSVSTGTITPPPSNLVVNGFMETANGANPQAWSPVYVGAITPIFTYPIVGVDGGKAASITISGAPAGGDFNARWQFDEVPIQTGVEYTYEAYYKGTTISDIIGRYTFNDGTEHFFGLKKEIPAAADWTFITGKFVGPVNVKSITLMHQISTNATLSLDNVKLYASGTGTPAEIQPPVVTFTNPLDGTTVSGTITLTANATDNVGVAGLFFAVDGTPLGPEMTAPFQQVWDSRTVANGTHTLKVTARDAAGNNSRQIITVTVNNTTPPPVTNLISNPSLEVAAGSVPQGWFTNKWGTNTATFTYPVTGQDGAKAAKVDVSGYTSGDAKWYFTDVPVTPGVTYTFSDYYQSSASSRLVVRFTSTSNALSYVELGSLPASASWVKTTKTITVPSGIKSMTVFHVLAANGSLTVDTYSLTAPSSVPPAPTVTFTASPTTVTAGNPATLTWTTTDATTVSIDQGVGTVTASGSKVVNPTTTTTYTLTATNATSTTTKTVTITVTASPPPSTNLVINPSLESAGTNGQPVAWVQDFWGTNTRVFTYPVTGYDGAKAARVDITAYTSGDAKWAFNHIAVTPGQTYTYTDFYQSNVVTNVVLEYKTTTGAYSYVDLAAAPASATWKQYQATFTVPANIQSVTVYHLLNKIGWLSVDAVSVVGP